VRSRRPRLLDTYSAPDPSDVHAVDAGWTVKASSGADADNGKADSREKPKLHKRSILLQLAEQQSRGDESRAAVELVQFAEALAAVPD
jgi:hypothetical protein